MQNTFAATKVTMHITFLRNGVQSPVRQTDKETRAHHFVNALGGIGDNHGSHLRVKAHAKGVSINFFV